MTLLLRPVHYIPRDGPKKGRCRIAEVIDHGIETVDLRIEADSEDFAWSFDADPMWKELYPCGIIFDAEGKAGTFHFDEQCPMLKRERFEADDRIRRYIGNKRRTDKRLGFDR